MAHGIIINSKERERAIAARVAAENNCIPLRLRCPECQKIFTIYIKDFDQGLYVLLGQACPYCKRFIKETDDPDALVVDAKEIREAIEKGDKGKQ